MGQSSTAATAAERAEQFERMRAADGTSATEELRDGWRHVGPEYGARSFLAIERHGETS
jgi:hypothetical protein